MSATIYDYIAINNRRTWGIVFMFPISLAIMIFLVLFAFFAITGEPNLIGDGLYYARQLGVNPFAPNVENLNLIPAAAVAALGFSLYAIIPIIIFTTVWLIIVYLSGDKMILAATDSRPISKSQNPQIYRLVENVAIVAGLPVPAIYIIEDESLNAFATGRNPKTASISLTTGIIKALNKQELEAVIAHEMAHIGNRDIRLMMFIIIGIGGLSFLSDILFRTMSGSGRSSGNKNSGGAVLIVFLVAIAIMLFSLIVAPILRFAISRSQEYSADSTAALITRNPAALASALTKISKDSRVEVLDKMPTVGALCIANPLGNARKRLFDSLAGLYATHPPIEKRIKALWEMDGQAGNDPAITGFSGSVPEA